MGHYKRQTLWKDFQTPEQSRNHAYQSEFSACSMKKAIFWTIQDHTSHNLLSIKQIE